MKRFDAPFFMNFTFYKPFAINREKNAMHVSYIGERPGVVTEAEMNAEKILEDESDDIHDLSPGTAAGHVLYAHERPRSHGLFSSEPVEDVKSIQQEVAAHQGIVWRVILSLTENDSIRLGYDKREAWENMLKTTVPLAAEEMGIPERNLRWVAAFHQEKGHPHVHLVLWDKEKKRSRGELSPYERKNIRKTFMKEIYAEERLRLNQEKTMYRDLEMALAKEDLVKTVELIREVRADQKAIELEMKASGAARSVGVPPKLHMSDCKELDEQIQELAAEMPDKGRIAYKFMPDDVKAKVDIISDWILKQPAQRKPLEHYLESVEQMTQHYTFQKDQIQAAKDKAYQDIRKRVSQIVLKAAVESKKDHVMKVVPEKAREVVEQFSKAMGAPEDVSKRVIRETIQEWRRLGLQAADQKRLFIDWQSQSNLRVDTKDIENMIEEEYSNPIDPSAKLNHPVAASAALILAGYSEQELRTLLQEQGTMQPEDIDACVSEAIRERDAAGEPFMAINDWQRFSDRLGITGEYPWKVEEIAIIETEARLQFLEVIRGSQLIQDIDPQEAGWTGFCIAVALKQLDVTKDERETIMLEWAARNQVSGMERILAKVEKDETNFLRKPTVEKIAENLGAAIKYPWLTHEVTTLDREALRHTLQQVENATQKPLTKEEVEWLGDHYSKLLNVIHIEQSAVIEDLKAWNDKTGILTEDELRNLFVEPLREEDIESLAKQFELPDLQRETVQNFAKVMFAAGLSSEDVHRTIREWNTRSGAGIPEAKLSKHIAAAERACKDIQSWGRTPVLSKKNFNALCKTLRVEAPWMWQGNREFRKFEKSLSVHMAQTVWKAIWRGIERERAQAQAKGEMMKRQLVIEQTRRQIQSQDEQER